MNLQQSVDWSDLTVPPKRIPRREISAAALADLVHKLAEEKSQPFWRITPEEWRNKWLPSKKFVLMEIPLTCAASPCEPKDREWVLTRVHAKSDQPIVVDVNKNRVGKAATGFVPEVIVIDGKHRFKAAALRGDTHILAWVGELAAAKLTVLAEGAEDMEPLHAMVAAHTKMDPAAVNKLIAQYQKIKGKFHVGGAIRAVAPPGMEGLVKKLKGHPEVDNPYKLAWWLHKNK